MRPAVNMFQLGFSRESGFKTTDRAGLKPTVDQRGCGAVPLAMIISGPPDCGSTRVPRLSLRGHVALLFFIGAHFAQKSDVDFTRVSLNQLSVVQHPVSVK
jgi:hypothetical protein